MKQNYKDGAYKLKRHILPFVKRMYSAVYACLIPGWSNYLRDRSDEWRDFHNFWLNYTKEQDIPIFILFYEDLVSDMERALTKLVHFLGVQLSSSDKQCVLDHSEGHFHRKYLPGESPFDKVEIDKENLNSKVDKIRKKIEECVSRGRCVTSGRNTL